MNIKFDRKSLKFKIWGYFVLLAVTILAILWCLQVLFLNNYYQGMKIHKVERTAIVIAETFHDVDFIDQMQKLTYKSDMIIRIEDSAGKVIFSTDDLPFRGPSKNIPQRNISFSDLRSKLMASESGTVSYIIKLPQINGEMLLFAQILPAANSPEAFLFVFSPLSPVDSTIGILKDQLVRVSMISLLLAFLISLLISSRITKPILNIAKEAEKLASGNFDVSFNTGSFSELDKLAGTLNHTAGELAKTDLLQKDLIANVSHDLRTPLTLVRSYAEMIRDISGSDPAKRNEHLQVIIDESERLGLLVDDLLALSKIQSGIERLNISSFNVKGMIERILLPYRILQEKSSGQLTVDCDDDIFLQADEQRIEQVLSNLLSNAFKYSGEDPSIAIRVREEGRKIRFEVADSGRGIPADELDHIWDRYYKAERQREAVGSGLGLAIVRQILELHKFRYGVSSTIGKGSVFWFETEKIPAAGTHSV